MEKKSLSESEWVILAELWEKEPQTIMQLVASLKEKTGWTKSTVITFLRRMEEKGAVAYDRIENAKHYYSVIKREDAAVPETKSFLKRIYNGSLSMMMNSLIEQNALTDEDISELYGILKKAKESEKK